VPLVENQLDEVDVNDARRARRGESPRRKALERSLVALRAFATVVEQRRRREGESMTVAARAVAPIDTRRAVMVVLLSGHHHPRSRAELEREIASVNGDRIAVADAINDLYGAGLLHLTGELVTPTRAARMMDELSEGAM
jgi:hypothetical protein